jgi:hypothetical protein
LRCRAEPLVRGQFEMDAVHADLAPVIRAMQPGLFERISRILCPKKHAYRESRATVQRAPRADGGVRFETLPPDTFECLWEHVLCVECRRSVSASYALSRRTGRATIWLV